MKKLFSLVGISLLLVSNIAKADLPVYSIVIRPELCNKKNYEGEQVTWFVSLSRAKSRPGNNEESTNRANHKLEALKQLYESKECETRRAKAAI
jgi:hypothetical protein